MPATTARGPHAASRRRRQWVLRQQAADDGKGSNGSDGSEDDAADGFEDAPEEAEDTTIDELLDDMQARLNRDVQKRMNEHGRNWRLIDSKANTELADKLEDQRDKREQRAH